MKRYVTEDNEPLIEDPEGNLVLYGEALAEIERLRGLVREAFFHGYSCGEHNDGPVDYCWEQSLSLRYLTKARKAPQ
jgi:hypothetical protein